MAEIKLEASWKTKLKEEFSKSYMTQLQAFLREEEKRGKVIYPPSDKIFTAMNTTPFDQVKVVILGQDPYHGPGQAHGLAFSVPEGVRPPPSLKNIFKELHSDLGVPIPKSGNLIPWARQGVLLLNAVLTVEAGNANSHQGKGWEIFTDAAIQHINKERDHVAFLLWGSYAQKKAGFVDRKKHLVLESAHPSPLSAHRGFLGSKPFSKINKFLICNDLKPIDWSLS